MVLRAGLDPTTLRWQNFFIAHDAAGAIAGIAQIKPYTDCREFGSLVVVPHHRRQGVGAMLVEHALAGESAVVRRILVPQLGLSDSSWLGSCGRDGRQWLHAIRIVAHLSISRTRTASKINPSEGSPRAG